MYGNFREDRKEHVVFMSKSGINIPVWELCLKWNSYSFHEDRNGNVTSILILFQNRVYIYMGQNFIWV